MAAEHRIVVHKAGTDREAFWGAKRTRPLVSKVVESARSSALKTDQALADAFVKDTGSRSEKSD